MSDIVRIKRATRETNIELGFRLYGTGMADISTGVGFFDHMLTLFAVHGLLGGKAKVPLVVTNHTYDQIGTLFPQKIMGGELAYIMLHLLLFFFPRKKKKTEQKLLVK
jgi:imidazoleglycerol-phosphate dehydratase